MSTTEWPRTLSIHIPDSSTSEHRISIDDVLTPPGLSNGSYTLVSAVEFNETTKHYRYKNYELSITVDSTKVTTPIEIGEKWRPYLIVYKHTKKTPPKVPSAVSPSPLKENDNEEPPRKIMRTLGRKNDDVVSDKKSDPVEKKSRYRKCSI